MTATRLQSFGRYAALAFSLLALLLLAACSSSARAMNRDGNKLFAEEAYEQALQAYQAALEKDPERSEPYYNAANAFYRQESYVESIALLQTALATAQDAEMEERVFYNAGNAYFQIASFDAAAEAYIAALLRDPNDMDAKYNLELTLMLADQPSPPPPEPDPEEDPDPNEEQQQPQEPPAVQPPSDTASSTSDGEGLSREDAEKILANVVNDGQTMQDHLGPFEGSDMPPVQDW